MKNLQLVYPAVFSPSKNGGYDVIFPDFPGCVTYGNTMKEAQQYAGEALKLWLEEMQSHGENVPKKTRRPIINEVAVQLA